MTKKIYDRFRMNVYLNEMSSKSTFQCLNDFPNCDEIVEINQERREIIENLRTEINNLQQNVDYILQPFWQKIKNEMFDLKNHIKEQNEKLQQLKISYQKQSKNLEKALNELQTIQNTSFDQSVYITSLSSTFGTLLWKTSKECNVVQNIITSNIFNELLQVINNSVKSFFEIYPDKSEKSGYDGNKRFIVPFIGIISNIAASIEGRKILMDREEGINLINELMNALPKIPTHDITLEKIILVTLFNISIHRLGLSLIENEHNLLKRLVNNILCQNELKQISLKLLQSITYDNRNRNLIEFLTNMIHCVKSHDSNDKGLSQLQDFVNEIKKNL